MPKDSSGKSPISSPNHPSSRRVKPPSFSAEEHGVILGRVDPRGEQKPTQPGARLLQEDKDLRGQHHQQRHPVDQRTEEGHGGRVDGERMGGEAGRDE